MSVIIEYEVEYKADFDFGEVIRAVVEKSLSLKKCPYEAEVNVTLTNNEGIALINKEYRQIDAPTDVLSFPMLEYETAGSFSEELCKGIELEAEDYFNMDTGELMLGDIVLSVDRIYSQAKEYGHSVKRELAFLVAHSMMHLMGYDHIEEEEAKIMEAEQEQVLKELNISRD